MFGTRFSNPDSVIQIQNHWVPHQKKMFGTWYLSEDWNPNLNFMWVTCQIWVQPFACFWIQYGFKSGLNSCGSQTTQFLIHFSLPSRSVWSFSLSISHHSLLLQTAPSPAPKRRYPLLSQAAPIWWLCRWVWWRFFMGLMVKSWWICRCFVGLMLKSWGFADAALI